MRRHSFIAHPSLTINSITKLAPPPLHPHKRLPTIHPNLHHPHIRPPPTLRLLQPSPRPLRLQLPLGRHLLLRPQPELTVRLVRATVQYVHAQGTSWRCRSAWRE